MPIIHQCAQRSEAWYKAKLGIPSASCFDKIVTSTGKFSKQSESYKALLLAEYFLGAPIDKVQTSWMEHGQQQEESALRSFEFETDLETQAVGFITNDAGTLGCSPDRLIGDNGLLELKAPAPQTHIAYLLNHSVADEYRQQVQGQLLVTEREFAYAYSYFPGLPALCVRTARDEPFIKLMADALKQFTDGLAEAREQLIAEYGQFRRVVRQVTEDTLGVSDADVEMILDARRRRDQQNATQ